MAEAISLALEFRTNADEAVRDLERMKAAAAKVEQQATGYGRSVDEAGRRVRAANDNAAASADRLTRSVTATSTAFRTLRSVVAPLLPLFSVAALTRYADAWSDMQSRVGAAIRDMEAAPAMMSRIVEIANASYSPLSQTVEIFSRNIAVLRDLGRSAADAADFTEALNHALVTTATKGQDADVVLNALSRSIAIGGLRSMEFETIMSRSPRVLEAIAHQLGVSVTQLRAFAQEGKVTGSVIVDALINNLERLRKEAAEMPATIGDAFVRIGTNITAFVGRMDKAAGASEMVATALLSLADHIGRVITYAATAVTMFGIRYVGAMALAYASTVTLSGALAFLRAALIRTGIGALIVAAGELVYQFTRLIESTGGFSSALVELGRRGSLVMYGLKFTFLSVTESIRANWYDMMASILNATEQSFSEVLRWFGITADQVAARIEDLQYRAWNMREAAGYSASIAQANFADAFSPIPGLDAKLPTAPLPPAPPAPDEKEKKAADAYKRLVEGAREFIAVQRLEQQVMGMTDREANRLRYTHDLLNEAIRAGVDLTQKATDGIRTKRAELVDLALAMADAEAATRKMQEAFELGRNVAKGFVDSLIGGLREGKNAWDAFANAAITSLEKITDKRDDRALDALMYQGEAA